MFAKPFVAALDGHADGVYAMARDPQTLSCVASGAGDGEVRVWSLSEQASTLVLPDAHEGMVRDLCFAPVASTSGMAVDDEDEDDENVNVRQPSRLLTCGVDRTVKLWAPRGSATPLQTWNGSGAFQSISHHRSEPTFATATDEVLIWDMARSEPILSLAFAESGGARRNAAKDASAGEHLTCVRFNQSETSVLAASGSDRTVCLFDARMASATSRLHLQVRYRHRSSAHLADARQPSQLESVATDGPAHGQRGPEPLLVRRPALQERAAGLQGPRRRRHVVRLVADRPRIRQRLVRPDGADLEGESGLEPRCLPHQAHAAVRRRCCTAR